MVLVLLKNFLVRSNSPESRTESNAYSRLCGHGLQCEDSYGTMISTDSQRLRTDGSVSPFPDKAQDEVSSTSGSELQPYFRQIDPRVISDATIGLSDGLTVPFALTAGLSALGDSKVVIAGGLAELIAGAISMGLGGWLAAKSEADAYRSLLGSTKELVRNDPDHAAELLRGSLAPLSRFLKLDCLSSTGFAQIAAPKQISRVTTERVPASTDGSEASDEESFDNDDSELTQLLMRYHHCSPSAPSQARALISALTIATGYFCGGFVPLIPYFFASEVGVAFWWSVGVMVIALGCFGAGKTWLVSSSGSESVDKRCKTNQRRRSWRAFVEIAMGSIQMILLGGIAAAAAMGLVIAFDLP